MKQFNNEYSSLSQIDNETIDYGCYENKARTLRAQAFIKTFEFSMFGKLYSSAKKMMAQSLSFATASGQKSDMMCDCTRNPATC